MAVSTSNAAQSAIKTPPVQRTLTSQLRAALEPQRGGVVYALFLIVVVFVAITGAEGLPAFLAITNVRNILDQSSVDGILAISMTVLLITGNFDLSIGANAGLSAGVGLDVANHYGAALGVVAALAVGTVIGFVNGALVQWAGVNAFIVTLGTLTVAEGVLLIVSNGQTILAKGTQFASVGTGTWTIPTMLALLIGCLLVVGCAAATSWHRRRGSRALSSSTIALGLGGALVLVVAGAWPTLLRETRETWLMFLVMVLAAAVLRYTIYGRRLYAVGGNSEAARLSGIRIGPYRLAAFMLCGLAAGFAGILYAGKFAAVPPTALSTEELPVIAAAVLGGTSLFGGSGFVAKTIVGVLILHVLSNGFSLLNLGANYQYVVQGVVIVGAAAVYTLGARKRRAARATPQESPEIASKDAALTTPSDEPRPTVSARAR